MDCGHRHWLVISATHPLRGAVTRLSYSSICPACARQYHPIRISPLGLARVSPPPVLRLGAVTPTCAAEVRPLPAAPRADCLPPLQPVRVCLCRHRSRVRVAQTPFHTLHHDWVEQGVAALSARCSRMSLIRGVPATADAGPGLVAPDLPGLVRPRRAPLGGKLVKAVRVGVGKSSGVARVSSFLRCAIPTMGGLAGRGGDGCGKAVRRPWRERRTADNGPACGFPWWRPSGFRRATQSVGPKLASSWGIAQRVGKPAWLGGLLRHTPARSTQAQNESACPSCPGGVSPVEGPGGGASFPEDVGTSPYEPDIPPAFSRGPFNYVPNS